MKDHYCFRNAFFLSSAMYVRSSVKGGLPAALVLQEGPEDIPDGRLEGGGLHAQALHLQPRALQLGVLRTLRPGTRRLLCQLKKHTNVTHTHVTLQQSQ